MNHRKIITAIAAAVVVIVGAACDPEDIDKAQYVAERVAAVDVAPERQTPELRATRLPTAEYTEVPHEAWVSCDPVTLQLVNTGSEPFDYEAWYGPRQAPLTWWVVDSYEPYMSHAPNLQPGESAAIDLSLAIDDEATLFLNGGAVYDVAVTAC